MMCIRKNLIDRAHKKIANAFLVFITITAVQAQDYEGYTFEESKAYHKEFSLENWGDGGDLSRYVFLNFTEFWPHTLINRSGSVNELPFAPREDVANFITRTKLGELSLQDYIKRSTVDGVIILHKGRIVFEDYPRMFPSDKHIYMSVSKTFVSTLIAILEDRAQIDVTKPIDTYFPEFKGSDWERIQVLNILDMSTGIDCHFLVGESEPDPNGCFQQFMDAFGFPSKEKALDNPLENLTTMQSHRPAGQIFEYSDVNTVVLTWLVERITGLKFTDFLEREIWQPMGAESDAMMLNAAHGSAATPLGVNSTLRDMARFGLLFVPSGRKDPKKVISDAYLQKIQKGGRPAIFAATDNLALDVFDDPKSKEHLVDGEQPRHNTYQWDIVMKDGDFYKGGYAGQGLYISPDRDLVITFFGTFDKDHIYNQMPLISRQLAKSGLFN